MKYTVCRTCVCSYCDADSDGCTNCETCDNGHNSSNECRFEEDYLESILIDEIY